MIYLDNAATSGFKTYAVTETAINTLKYLSANPGRSGHRLSLKGAETIYNARVTLKNAFNAPMENKVIFTDGCTSALNMAILGSVKQGKNVVTTVFEHNSVLRPLYYLKNIGAITLTIVEPIKGQPFYKTIADAVTKDTYLVVVNGASNVTGEVVDVYSLGKLLKDKDVLFMVDGAQILGHVDFDMQDANVDILAVAGHKALGGILGSGALILSEKADLSPTKHGGTGSETFNLSQPTVYPERLEAGTLNLPAIASLNEGVRYASTNLEHFGKQLYLRTQTLIENLKSINGVKCYSFPNPSGIVAFSLKSLSSEACADLLNANYDVAVRGGFHCAPLMHKYLKTDSNGLIRASIAVQNSSSEINYFVSAVKELAKNN
jgi:selenocysteine lyase/cysteine desulfurase